MNFNSFSSELQKISASMDWKSFERNLGKSEFQREIALGSGDKKLKKYTKNVGAHRQSSEVVEKAPSRSSNTQYSIKRLPSGRLSCDCKDWQYKHSWKGTDCDHIRALKKSGLQKLSNAILRPVLTSALRGMSGARTADRAQKNYQIGLDVKRLQNAKG